MKPIEALNDFVVKAGGRIYLAKDAFTRRDHFRAMEPRLERFLEVRRKWDPLTRIRSAQSVRLFGDRETAPRDASTRKTAQENGASTRAHDAKVMP